VGSSIEHAFDCDVECVEHAEALALDEALVTTLEKMVNEDLDSPPSTLATSRPRSRPRKCPSTLLPPRARR
jgi:hypothetical protein